MKKRLYETGKEQLKEQIEENVWLTKLNIMRKYRSWLTDLERGLKTRGSWKKYRQEQPTDNVQGFQDCHAALHLTENAN